jgi:hypothetical protein
MKRTLLIICITSASVQAFAPTNFFNPYDPNLRLPSIKDTNFQVGVNAEYGSTNSGRNIDEKQKNILQIYQSSQTTIPMLMNPTPGLKNKSTVDALLLGWNTPYAGQPLDDGTRGHLVFCGDFSQIDVTLSGEYKIPFDFGAGDLFLSGYLPVRNADISNISFTDQTLDIFAVDKDIKESLTSKTVLSQWLKTNGDLDIGPSNLTGLGDLVLMLGWRNSYLQKKEQLQNVDVFAKIGLSIPTAKTKNEDKVFEVPLGNDGAWGLPIGMGIGLDFVYNIRLGADVDFVILFDKSKNRRLKTEEHQTDFLLLNKGFATKNYGLTWKFNLFLQAYRFLDGLSAKIAYEYVKHDDDRLTPLSDDFSSQVINTAKSLEEWNTQDLIFQLNYDCIKESKNWSVVPQANIFLKVPVGGKCVINPITFGGQIGVNF